MSKSFPSPPSRAMQWTGMAILTILTLVVLVLPLITAYITKNAFYLIPTAGTIPLGFVWSRLALFLYKRPEDYRLEELKIKSRSQVPHPRKLVS